MRRCRMAAMFHIMMEFLRALSTDMYRGIGYIFSWCPISASQYHRHYMGVTHPHPPLTLYSGTFPSSLISQSCPPNRSSVFPFSLSLDDNRRVSNLDHPLL